MVSGTVMHLEQFLEITGRSKLQLFVQYGYMALTCRDITPVAKSGLFLCVKNTDVDCSLHADGAVNFPGVPVGKPQLSAER